MPNFGLLGGGTCTSRSRSSSRRRSSSSSSCCCARGSSAAAPVELAERQEANLVLPSRLARGDAFLMCRPETLRQLRAVQFKRLEEK